MLATYDNVLALMKVVPGLGNKVVEDFVAEIGLDMSVFPDEKHFCSRVGIAPGNNESASKKDFKHIYLRMKRTGLWERNCTFVKNIL